MRYLLIIPLLVLLASCTRLINDPETGATGVTVEPLVGQSRLVASEKAAKDYCDTLADGQVALAEQIGNAQVAMEAEAAKVERQVEQDKFDLEDIYSSEWFWILLSAAGLGEFGRRRVKKAKAELPEDFEDVSDEYEE